MTANDAVRVLSEREMEAIVGGTSPPVGPPSGDNDGVVLK